jgi:hypothetical protein
LVLYFLPVTLPDVRSGVHASRKAEILRDGLKCRSLVTQFARSPKKIYGFTHVWKICCKFAGWPSDPMGDLLNRLEFCRGYGVFPVQSGG